MGDEFGRVLSPFTVVDAVAPKRVVVGYMPSRLRSTESCSKYGVSSETGQCMWNVLLSVVGIGSV